MKKMNGYSGCVGGGGWVCMDPITHMSNLLFNMAETAMRDFSRVSSWAL